MQPDQNNPTQPEPVHQPGQVFNPGIPNQNMPLTNNDPSLMATSSVNPAPYATTMQPSTPVFSGQTMNIPAGKSKRKTLLLILSLVLIACIAAGLYLTLGKKKVDKSASPTTSSSTTTHLVAPTDATTLDMTSAEKVFTSFIGGVQAKDQAFADSLSSSYFKAYQKIAFAAPDGNWLTVKTPVRGIVEIIGGFPKPFTGQTLTNIGVYARPANIDSSLSAFTNEPGITVGYNPSQATLDKLKIDRTPEHNQLQISFVLENGKLVVDEATFLDPDPFSQ